jgi:hypothetical protein
VDNELPEELCPIQIDRAAADLAPEDGDVVLPAVGQIYLLPHVLMVTDTDIRGAGGEQDESLAPQARQSVVEKLGILPGYRAEKIEFHQGYLLRTGSQAKASRLSGM